ncbi:MAG: dhpH [Planctomycetaceae bacterium]|nr:dhpH [Planctomycetaceae bacterium]
MLTPKVVVIGGSLGGLFSAIALRDLGYGVSVFEKSSGLMRDRGAGIVLQSEVTELFRRYSIGTTNEISVPVRDRRYLNHDGTVAEDGRMAQDMTSWDMLYRKLREKFPDDKYHTETHFQRFDDSQRIVAHFDGGRTEECDLLIGADGPGSLVRQQLLPQVVAEYAGYVAWRGVVPEAEHPELAREFAGRFTFFQASHTHILCYLIPGLGGVVTPGQRRINWVWYINAAPGPELDRVLTDKDGRRLEFSVPQGFVSTTMTDWLYEEARRILPPTFRRLVEGTREPFVQTIHDLAVPKMAFGRVCLTGDAAFVPRPHTAASTAKAAANATALRNHLTMAKGDVIEALQAWEPDQLEMGRRLRIHGQRLGNRSQFGR